MITNPVVWFEIYVSDMPRAKKFYESVFQKKLEQLSDPTESNIDMWAFPSDFKALGSAGTLCKMEGFEPGPGGTIVYFNSEDCSIEEKRATTSGGKVLQQKMSIGPHGFVSLIQDSEGNTIGLHSMN